MSESTPIPVLRLLDVEPVGVCDPDSDYCDVPGLRAEASDNPDVGDPTVQDGKG